MSTSRSQSEIEKDKNEGFNLAPYKADPATRTNTPHFYINNEYQELPKQAYITDKPYTFWANNLRGCIGVLNNQSEILGHIYLKVCELEGSSFKESTQELGDGCSEIQAKLNRQTIDIRKVLEQDRQSINNNIYDVLTRIKKLDNKQELQSYLENLEDNQEKIIKRIDEINSKRIQEIQNHIESILENQSKGGNTKQLSRDLEKLKESVIEVDNNNFNQLKKELRDCCDKQQDRSKSLDQIFRNLPSKQDLESMIKEEIKNIPKQDTSKLESKLENLASKEDLRNEMGKIPKTDTSVLEEKIGKLTSKEDLKILPTKENLELIADSLSEEIGQEHEKTRGIIHKQDKKLDEQKESLDRIRTDKLQEQLEETLKQLEESQRRKTFLEKRFSHKY